MIKGATDQAIARMLQRKVIEIGQRKANAIENVFIPRLESAVKFITFRLEEMERDTFAMLKTVKRKMSEREENVEVEAIAN